MLVYAIPNGGPSAMIWGVRARSVLVEVYALICIVGGVYLRTCGDLRCGCRTGLGYANIRWLVLLDILLLVATLQDHPVMDGGVQVI